MLIDLPSPHRGVLYSRKYLHKRFKNNGERNIYRELENDAVNVYRTNVSFDDLVSRPRRLLDRMGIVILERSVSKIPGPYSTKQQQSYSRVTYTTKEIKTCGDGDSLPKAEIIALFHLLCLYKYHNMEPSHGGASDSPSSSSLNSLTIPSDATIPTTTSISPAPISDPSPVPDIIPTASSEAKMILLDSPPKSSSSETVTTTRPINETSYVSPTSPIELYSLQRILTIRPHLQRHPLLSILLSPSVPLSDVVPYLLSHLTGFLPPYDVRTQYLSLHDPNGWWRCRLACGPAHQMQAHIVEGDGPSKDAALRVALLRKVIEVMP